MKFGTRHLALASTLSDGAAVSSNEPSPRLTPKATECGVHRLRSRLDERRLHLALVARVALEAIAQARVVVALAAAAALVVIVVGGDRLRHVRELRAERLDVDAREQRRAARAALRGVDHEEVLRALHA